MKPKEIISLVCTLVFPSARDKKGMYPDTFQSECNTRMRSSSFTMYNQRPAKTRMEKSYICTFLLKCQVLNAKLQNMHVRPGSFSNYVLNLRQLFMIYGTIRFIWLNIFHCKRIWLSANTALCHKQKYHQYRKKNLKIQNNKRFHFIS